MEMALLSLRVVVGGDVVRVENWAVHSLYVLVSVYMLRCVAPINLKKKDRKKEG